MSFDKINFSNKIVIIRVDYNVPFDGDIIQDDSRIKKSIYAINHVVENGGKVLIVSHLGRPKNNKDKNLSFKKIINPLKKYFSSNVFFLEKHPSLYDYEYIKNHPCDIFLLENIRFYKEEILGGCELAKNLASLADVYINDAFSASHRKHSSVFTICDFFKKKYIGPLFKKEIKEISHFIKNPNPPTSFIFGGSKLSTKIKTINNVIKYADNIIIGGAMAFPFLKQQGFDVLSSKCEDGYEKEVNKINENCKKNNVNLLIPEDIVFTDNLDKPSFIENINIKKSGKYNKSLMGVDIGESTISKFSFFIEKSNSVIWNGPMGVFEKKEFMLGTKKISLSVSKAGKSLVGGGDTVSAVKQINMENDFSYVSMGGGAILDFLSKESLPVLEKIN